MKRVTLKRFLIGAFAGAMSVQIMDLLKDAGYLAGAGAILRAVLSACIVGALFSFLSALLGNTVEAGGNKDVKQ